jgi:molecular chaperone GrpE
LQRAIEAYQQDPNGDGLAQGVAMVSSQISKALENHGCKKIEAVGAPFDPNHHQALQMQPSDDHPANTVMMDLRPGFLLHDRLIRPAQVFVSTGAAKEA